MGRITDTSLRQPVSPYGGPPRDAYFGTIFGTPDFTNVESRFTRSMNIGGKIGVSIGVINAMVYEGADPFNQRWDTKRFILWRTLKFGTLGVSAGALYVTGVTAANKLRGKDDPLNHFFGGFGLSSVYSYIRGGCLSTFVIGGIYFGLAGALMKHLYMENWAFENVITDKAHFVTNCRYPEFYVLTVDTHDLPKEEKN